MKLSIIIAFYNMQREAPRTLYSASPEYQQGGTDIDYEVIALDNGSTHPLRANLASTFGSNFKQSYFESEYPSPCMAINAAVKAAKGEFVMCCIDGARILSPGIVRKSIKIADAYRQPFIYTLGMHLGEKVQPQSMLEGYNQETEDKLLESINWQHNGYDLFNISSVAVSSKQGFFSNISESNCFIMRREDYLAMGGFNEKFISPGGGLCNLDIFKRAHEVAGQTPIMLLGEATFHQFHGGVATNTPPAEFNFQRMNEEYRDINGELWQEFKHSPVYFGEIPQQAKPFINTLT